jgi:hypothetical protein
MGLRAATEDDHVPKGVGNRLSTSREEGKSRERPGNARGTKEHRERPGNEGALRTTVGTNGQPRTRWEQAGSQEQAGTENGSWE